MTFFTEEDSGQLRSVANLVKEAGGEVPDWMTQLKKERNKTSKKLPSQVSIISVHILGVGMFQDS